MTIINGMASTTGSLHGGGAFTKSLTIPNYAYRYLFALIVTDKTDYAITISSPQFNSSAMTYLTDNLGITKDKYYVASSVYISQPDIGNYNLSFTTAATTVYIDAAYVCVCSDKELSINDYRTANGTTGTSTSVLTTANLKGSSNIYSFLGLVGVADSPSATGHTELASGYYSGRNGRAEIGYCLASSQLTTQYSWTNSAGWYVGSIEVVEAGTSNNGNQTII